MPGIDLAMAKKIRRIHKMANETMSPKPVEKPAEKPAEKTPEKEPTKEVTVAEVVKEMENLSKWAQSSKLKPTKTEAKEEKPTEKQKFLEEAKSLQAKIAAARKDLDDFSFQLTQDIKNTLESIKD